MLSAYLVCDIHELLKRPVLLSSPAVFVRFKSPAVDAVGVIEHAMQVGMLLVDMAGHEILVFAFKELLTYLLTELQCSFGSNFPRLETDDKVLGKNGTSACSVRPYFFKVMVSLFGLTAAPLREDQSAVVRLFRVGDVFQ